MLLDPFLYQSNPYRILFGPGKFADLGRELSLLGVQRALLLSTPQQVDLAERGARDLGDMSADIFSGATMHTPEIVTQEALNVLKQSAANGLVALGGGSTIGLGKALALRTSLPLLAVPTTYAGSEMTRILGETRDGLKTTQVSPLVLPRTVIYDAELTIGLPVGLSVVSGFNAMAHAVEALYAANANPVMSLMAQEGIRAFASSLPAIVENLENREARTEALYGAWLCGMCLGNAGMALHHKICHVLGGTFQLPHAETHTVMLPHVLAYNARAIPNAMRILSLAVGTDDPAVALYRLAKRLGAPISLADLGMPEAGLEEATTLALKDSYPNPRPIEKSAIRAMLDRAHAGLEPADM